MIRSQPLCVPKTKKGDSMSDEKTPEEIAAETVAGELNPDDWQEGEATPVEHPGGVADLAAPKKEHVDVTCVGCNNTFGFDIDSKTEGFTFQCTVCKTQTAWTRA